MKRLLFLSIMSFCAMAADPPRTMRLDYFHGGTATEEQFSFDGVVLEGPMGAVVFWTALGLANAAATTPPAAVAGEKAAPIPAEALQTAAEKV